MHEAFVSLSHLLTDKHSSISVQRREAISYFTTMNNNKVCLLKKTQMSSVKSGKNNKKAKNKNKEDTTKIEQLIQKHRSNYRPQNFFMV